MAAMLLRSAFDALGINCRQRALAGGGGTRRTMMTGTPVRLRLAVEAPFARVACQGEAHPAARARSPQQALRSLEDDAVRVAIERAAQLAGGTAEAARGKPRLLAVLGAAALVERTLTGRICQPHRRRGATCTLLESRGAVIPHTVGAVHPSVVRVQGRQGSRQGAGGWRQTGESVGSRGRGRSTRRGPCSAGRQAVGKQCNVQGGREDPQRFASLALAQLAEGGGQHLKVAVLQAAQVGKLGAVAEAHSVVELRCRDESEVLNLCAEEGGALGRERREPLRVRARVSADDHARTLGSLLDPLLGSPQGSMLSSLRSLGSLSSLLADAHLHSHSLCDVSERLKDVLIGRIDHFRRDRFPLGNKHPPIRLSQLGSVVGLTVVRGCHHQPHTASGAERAERCEHA
eukprot:scaffold273389_cov29-Tisochrysis_lutea.AAC.8